MELSGHTDAVDAAIDALLAVPRASGADTVHVLQALEHAQRRMTGLGLVLVREVAESPGVEFGGQRDHDVLADALRIHPREARERLREAADLTPGHAITGQELEPTLPALAKQVAAGEVGREHVRVIRSFLKQLPATVDHPTRLHAEHDLADAATTMRPDELKKLAIHLDAILNPDGTLTDEHDRQRRRGITLGDQDRDGLSRISGELDPECRAYLEAVLAKYAAPGACNPDDPTPAVDTAPSDEQAQRDPRSVRQRNHDAVKAALRGMIASGELGQHNGLPVTVVITCTLEDLEDAVGCGTTAGGTRIPIHEVIRMAGHAHHYLSVFRKHTLCPLYLGRTKRVATPDQRIVQFATYLGCSFPSCPRPALDCQQHHQQEWGVDHGPTDITNLIPVCAKHHKLVDRGWTVHRHPDGWIDWTPPTWIDPRQRPRHNTYHRPSNRYRRAGGRPRSSRPQNPGPPSSSTRSGPPDRLRDRRDDMSVAQVPARHRADQEATKAPAAVSDSSAG